jgi:hypothetical protein
MLGHECSSALNVIKTILLSKNSVVLGCLFIYGKASLQTSNSVLKLITLSPEIDPFDLPSGSYIFAA